MNVGLIIKLIEDKMHLSLISKVYYLGAY